jgi:hypothetical protein
MGSRRGLSRVRFAAPICGAPWTVPSCSQQPLLRRGKGGRWKLLPSWDRSSARHDLLSDPPAVPHNCGLPEEDLSSNGTYPLFRGRPDVPNSIFADGPELFPQMDVWSRCCVGRTETDRFGKIDGPHCRLHGDASGNSFRECRRCVFSLS